MLIIGSQALKYYDLLKDRSPADWDLMDEKKSGLEIENKIVIDWSDSLSLLEPSNKLIYDYSFSHSSSFILTPKGQGLVAPAEVLKLLKLSSLALKKNKDKIDLLSLDHLLLPSELEPVLEMRKKETLAKIARKINAKKNQKEKFFHKYQIERYIPHDELHLYLSPAPAYKKFLLEYNEVEIDPRIFFSSSFEEKMLLIFEETLVLSLERFLIPKIKFAPMMTAALVRELQNLDSSFSPGVFWLNRLTTPNLLKDHPVWIAEWGAENYPSLLKELKKWWPQAIEDLSKEFWEKLLIL